MPLSSNSLIHLTKEKDSLIGVLQDNFRIYYCLENIITKKGRFNAAIPMVSFCDIPLSEIKNHISHYGSYGIGLKKDWAIRKGLNPVLYIEKESDLGAEVRYAGEILLKDKDMHNMTDIDYALYNLFRYMKNYQNDLTKGGVTINDYRFSDEREWRYVPHMKDATMFYSSSEYDTDEDKNKINDTISSLRLEFSPDDISYIFIKDESEITDFIDVLRFAKGKKYSVEQVERLMTRIFTTEQIKTDV